jgi:hypothetical protein
MVLSNDVYSALIINILKGESSLYSFIIFQTYLISANFLLYVLTLGVWNQKTENEKTLTLEKNLIMGVQFVSVFIILTNLTNEIVLCFKTKLMISHVTADSGKKIIIAMLLYLQLGISLISSYLCFINVGKRIDPIDIFKDVLAFSAVSQLDNLFNQLNNNDENAISVKNIEISNDLWQIKETKLRKVLFFSYIVIMILFYIIFKYTNVVETITGAV